MKNIIIYTPVLLLLIVPESQSVDVGISTNEELKTQLTILDNVTRSVTSLKDDRVQINNLIKVASDKKSSLLFEDSFENDFIPGKYWDHSGNKSIGRSKGLTNDGQYSLCFKLDKKESAVPERTELRLRKKIVEFFLGGEYWVGFSVFIPESWIHDPSAESLFQWHGFPDKDLGEGWRNPVFTLQVKNEYWQIISRWDEKKITPHMEGSGYSYSGRNAYKIGKIAPNSWTNWVLHIKWSYLSDGILDVWKDGIKVVEQRGGNAFNDSNGPYLKFGLYKWDWKKSYNKRHTVSTKREVCFKSLRIADETGSYEMVSP